MFDSLFPEGPTPRDGLIETALHFMEIGDYSAAREPLQEILDVDPDDAEVHRYLSLIAVEEEDWDAAERILRRGIESLEGQGVCDLADNSGNGWLHDRTRSYLKLLTSLARVCFVQQEFEEVKSIVGRVLELNPTDNLNVRRLYALVLHREGDLSQAIQMYRIVEGTPEVAYNLGLALLSQGKRDEAVLAFREGFFTNGFIAFLIMGQEPLYLFESAQWNRACEVDARAFDLHCGDLWAGKSEAAEFVSRLWRDPVVELETEEYNRLVDELQQCEDSEERDRIGEHLSSLRSPGRLSDTNSRILARVSV